MLVNLHVKNLALIDESEVDFGPGLNILTGETGAGKSILMGSVNLALGGRYTADMLRNGYSLVIFPEGTRSQSDEMTEFKHGSLKHPIGGIQTWFWNRHVSIQKPYSNCFC